MSATVVEGMARLLAAAGVGAFSTTEALPADAVPITVAHTPPDGELCVTLTTYPGGPEPDSRNGWEYPRLQVRVRAAGPLAALALDRECYDALQGAQERLEGGQLLSDCYALQSDAEPLGSDDTGRHEFARNYQLSIELPAGG